MFGKSKKQSGSSILALPEPSRRRGGYDRRATGISVDFVYQPESFAHEMRSGGYGELVEIKDVSAAMSSYPSEEFLGVCIVGTDAGRYLGKRLVNHFENYGFGHGYVFDVTKVVGIIPLKNAAGCGSCPGNQVVVSPGYGFSEGLDTLYHEYCHNIGWDHEYEVPGDNQSRQLNTHKDPIYIDAAKAAAHLRQFGEA